MMLPNSLFHDQLQGWFKFEVISVPFQHKEWELKIIILVILVGVGE